MKADTTVYGDFIVDAFLLISTNGRPTTLDKAWKEATDRANFVVKMTNPEEPKSSKKTATPAKQKRAVKKPAKRKVSRR